MNQEKFNFEFEVFDNKTQLSSEDQELMQKAIESRENAYAPYSKFKVGAALLLENGVIVTGNNQENAAYPSGLCAERTAFFYASAQYPNVKILKVAITAAAEHEKLIQAISPCGACRQSMYEYEHKQQSAIEVIFGTDDSKIYKIQCIKNLLPFSFNADLM